MSRLTVTTVVGPRPELIRLSLVVFKLAQATDHPLVHAGQNYRDALNGVLDRELGRR